VRLIIPLLIIVSQLSAQKKSPTTALLYSLGGTMVPITTGTVLFRYDRPVLGSSLILLGLIVGPSLGHLYAGETLRGCGSTGLRTGVVLMGLTAAALFTHRNVTKAIHVRQPKGDITLAIMAVPLFFSVAFDIATAPVAAHRHNRRMELQHHYDIEDKRTSLGFEFRF
jgi:hypothetical protein